MCPEPLAEVVERCDTSNGVRVKSIQPAVKRRLPPERSFTHLTRSRGGRVRAAQGSGYFRVERYDGVWWLVDPSGASFLSIGVNGVNRGWDPRPPRYDAVRLFPSTSDWERDVVSKVRRWGFNTLGAWADPGLIRRARLPYAVLLSLGPQLHLPWTDFWGKDVEDRALELARVWTKDYRDDPLLLGYFAGNDFPWWDENLFWHFL